MVDLIGDDSKQVLYSFKIHIPLVWSVSGEEEFHDKLKRYCDRKGITKTEFTDKILKNKLRSVDISGWDGLLKSKGQYDNFRRILKESFQELCNVKNISAFIVEEGSKKFKK